MLVSESKDFKIEHSKYRDTSSRSILKPLQHLNPGRISILRFDRSIMKIFIRPNLYVRWVNFCLIMSN